MPFLTTVIEGTEYGAETHPGLAGTTRYNESYSDGLFTRRADGAWQQQLGHGQTPAFRSETSFRRWVLRHTLEARALARVS